MRSKLALGLLVICSGVLASRPVGALPIDWTIATIPSPGNNEGTWTSLALDAEGRPHISYHNLSHGDLKYAAWNGSSWSVETVDSAGIVGQYTSLALDSSGMPHISYYDRSAQLLKYATSNGSSWSVEALDSTWSGANTWTSIALDATGAPRISYNAHGELRYAAWDGSSWAIQTADGGTNGYYSSLVLDSSGAPRISYSDNVTDALKYAVWDGLAWQTETIATGSGSGTFGDWTSLALDTSGNPHIGFSEDWYNRIMYAAWNGVSWDIHTVDTEGDGFTSLALDNLDRPFMSYYDFYGGTFGALRLATFDGSSWSTQPVDAAPWLDVGGFSSLALDTAGDIHISYYNYGWGSLKYARGRVIPEPATLLLLGSGAIGLALMRRRRGRVHSRACQRG